MNGWIGVDLDGTLAYYDHWVSPVDIGEPIAPMVNRVKQWIADGQEVRIFTARTYSPPDNATRQMEAAQALVAIQHWCLRYIGTVLPVTCTKDFGMIELWDDRAIQVVKNTGQPVISS